EGIPPLPTDVTATLSSDTMLSPKFVALSAGTPGGGTLANNAAIEGHPAYGLEQITAAAGPLFDNANKLLDNLNVTVTGLKKDLEPESRYAILPGPRGNARRKANTPNIHRKLDNTQTRFANTNSSKTPSIREPSFSSRSGWSSIPFRANVLTSGPRVGIFV